MDELIGTFVTLEEAGAEVGKICDAFKNDDIDLTILLTHIGFESDKELAAMLRPGVGRGHDHRRAQPHHPRRSRRRSTTS